MTNFIGNRLTISWYQKNSWNEMMQFVLNFYGKWGLLDVVKSENNGICVVLTRDQWIGHHSWPIQKLYCSPHASHSGLQWLLGVTCGDQFPLVTCEDYTNETFLLHFSWRNWRVIFEVFQSNFDFAWLNHTARSLVWEIEWNNWEMFTSSLRSHNLKSGNISGKIRHCVTLCIFSM